MTEDRYFENSCGKTANAMSEDEWEGFYNALSKDLRRDYPDLYERLFSPKS